MVDNKELMNLKWGFLKKSRINRVEVVIILTRKILGGRKINVYIDGNLSSYLWWNRFFLNRICKVLRKGIINEE